MSQNTNFLSVNETSSDTLNNSNENCKSNSDITVVNNNGWANFDAFENNNTNQNSEFIPVVNSNDSDDDWAEFQSNTEHSIELSNDKQSEKEEKADDGFDEQQISSTSFLPINPLNTDQIELLISSCFPLESSALSPDSDHVIPFELPTFTTFKDQTKQLPCFEPSLCLWNVLSNIRNDPVGIQHQWRKSNAERLFHQALGVHQRFQHKMTPTISPAATITISATDVSPNLDWKQNVLESPLTDTNNSSCLTIFPEIEDNFFDVIKTPDLDCSIPPIPTSTSNTEEAIRSSPIIHRNNSPTIQQQQQQQQQPTPIKTMDLFPGSTTVMNDDPRPVVTATLNFSFMNPKALLSSTQNTHESMI